MGDASSGEWQGIVCRHGLLLVPGDLQRTLHKSALSRGGKLLAEPFTASQALESKMVLLGAPEDSLLLSDETGELAQPPIRVKLDGDLIDALSRPSFQRAVAMTHSGPRDPDKPCNQDFAIAADLVIAKKAFSVAVVCDGVSQKVFWPERSSRIAGLAALQALYRFLKGDEQRLLPELLQAAITGAYKEDREQLGDAPSMMFDPEYYARQREREANWYQSTVLVAALGGDGGFVSYVGDGAIVDLPRNGGFDPKLQTTEDFGLDHCASLVFQAHEFEAPVRLAAGERTLLIASDGIDRTAEASGSREKFFREAAAVIAGVNHKDRGKTLFAYLEQTSNLKYCASDNISLAWLTAPDQRNGGEVISAFGTLLDPPPAPPPPPQSQPAPSPPQQQPAYASRTTASPAAYQQPDPFPRKQHAYASSPPMRDRDDYGDRREVDPLKALKIALIVITAALLVFIGYLAAESISALFGGQNRTPTASQGSTGPDRQDDGEPVGPVQSVTTGPAVGTPTPGANLPGALPGETPNNGEPNAGGEAQSDPTQNAVTQPETPAKPPTNASPTPADKQQGATPAAKPAVAAKPAAAKPATPKPDTQQPADQTKSDPIKPARDGDNADTRDEQDTENEGGDL